VLGSIAEDVGALRIYLGTPETAAGGDQADRSVVIPDASIFDAFAICTPAGPDILAAEDGDSSICGVSAETRESIHLETAQAVISLLRDYSE
ncbi:MAG: hypothetical protein ACT6RT_16445, partial [Allorhizobium sp.]